MLKKILATALAAAMILGLASVAFAASFSDTADSPRESAIKRLAGLGILGGYPDGTFRPDKPITRAEFAKVIVYAMGLKDAADMFGGVPVGFADVPANHWAAGFIGIAATQGIVKGYPDGTFKPEANVNYAEAITMILRALGYEPVLKSGTWPTVFLTKAAELKINKGIVFSAFAPATRGDVAGLLANSLTVAKVIQVGYGDEVKYVVSGTDGTTRVSLLNDMGAKSVKGWLVSSPELFSNDGTKVKIAGEASYRDLAEDTEYSGLLGHKVRLWIDDNDEVFFIEDLTDPDDILAATALDEPDKVEIDDTGDTVTLPEDSLFRDFRDPVDPDLAEGEELTVICDDGEPKYAVINTYQWGVVDTVNTTYDRITFKESSDVSSLTLKDFDIIWSGAASSLDELEEGDVVQYIKAPGSLKEAILVVTRNSVTGEFTKLTSSAATVDGVAYTLADGYIGVTSSLLGESVTIYLNKDGELVCMVAEEADTTSTYAVVVGTDSYTEFGTQIRKIRLVNSDGSVGTYNVTSAVTEFSSVLPGDVIEYTTNSSGKVDSIDIVLPYASQTTTTIDDDLSTIEWTVGSSTKDYKITSSTIVFDLTAWADAAASDRNEDLIDVISVSKLLQNGDVTAAALISSGKVKVVVLTEGDATGDSALGMIYGNYRTVIEGERVWVLRILVDGEISDYVATDLDADKALSDPANLGATGKNKAVVSFTDLGSNELEDAMVLAPTVTSATYEARVSSIDAENGVVTIKWYDADGAEVGSAEHYLVDDETLYYDITGTTAASLELGEVAKMSKVSLYLDSDGFVDVLVVHPDE